MTRRILALSGSSSSIKFAVYDPGPPLAKVLAGEVERIGLGSSVLKAAGPAGHTSSSRLMHRTTNAACGATARLAR